MTRKSVQTIIKKRTRAYDNMTPAAKELAATLLHYQAQEAAGMILTAYGIGARLVRALAEDEAFHPRHLVEQMADYLDYADAFTLRALMTFTRVFPRDYVKHHSFRLMRSGGVLQTGHWLELMHVERQEDQEALLELILTESWSFKQLGDEIRARGIKRVLNPTGPAAEGQTQNDGGAEQLDEPDSKPTVSS